MTDIREITELAGLIRITELFNEIWHPASIPPISTEMLRALSKAGNYVCAAFEGEAIVGACAGFFGPPAEKVLHSHIAGVAASASGRNIGYALKMHQREWALRHGVTAIEWTFDPLVARNAYFNIGKLGGLPTEYLPDFYGAMDDGINGDDESDRLLLRWDLTAPHPEQDTPSGSVALGRDERGDPVLGSADGDIVLVAVPLDIEALRLRDPGQAKEWRMAVREVLGGLLGAGARVTGFDRDGWYVLRRGELG
jgi:predicted GNAT superfamily acetyltransferase